MGTVTNTTELPAPPEEVWAKLANPTTFKDWLTTHNGLAEGGEGQLSQGDTFKEKVKIMGMPGEVAWTVEECDEPRRLVLDGKGPMGTKMRTAYELTPNGESTTIAYEAEFGGAALGPMAGPLEKASKQSADESLENLKQLLS
jgi:carbon monoxide dehydrogenase subunit G